MAKKVLIPVIFIVIVFISIYSINELNRKQVNKEFINSITPSKYETIIKDFEDELIESPKIIVDNLNNNVYRQYKINDDTFGFIADAPGYEDNILVYVELSHRYKGIVIHEVKILYENETDGYGDYVVEPWFLDRFKQVLTTNLKVVKRKKTNDNQVIAITGATITSETVVNAVNDCRQIMEDSKNDKK